MRRHRSCSLYIISNNYADGLSALIWNNNNRTTYTLSWNYECAVSVTQLMFVIVRNYRLITRNFGIWWTTLRILGMNLILCEELFQICILFASPHTIWMTCILFSCWLSPGLTGTSKCILVYKGVRCRGCVERHDERMRKYNIGHMVDWSGFHFQSSKTRLTSLHLVIIELLFLFLLIIILKKNCGLGFEHSSSRSFYRCFADCRKDPRFRSKRVQQEREYYSPD